MKVRILCPAKINSFLAVGKPEANGKLHPIRTVMHCINWYDELILEEARETTLECSWRGLPAQNTLTKAMGLIEELFPVPKLRIQLTKNVPSQAGLGGGSSNAAALIRGICHFMRMPVGEFFYDVALATGSDVPFFLIGGAAKAEGFGEKLAPIEDLPPRHLLVIKPKSAVSTGEAYQMLDQHEYEFNPFPHEPWALHNDFSRTEPCISGELCEHMLVHGASGAQLSGSGSAVFGLYDEYETANIALQALSTHFGDEIEAARVCQTLSRAESLNLEHIA